MASPILGLALLTLVLALGHINIVSGQKRVDGDSCYTADECIGGFCFSAGGNPICCSVNAAGACYSDAACCGAHFNCYHGRCCIQGGNCARDASVCCNGGTDDASCAAANGIDYSTMCNN